MATPTIGPRRVWRRRVKGWRMPPATVLVDRTSPRWGNPFPIREGFRDRATAPALYTALVDELGETIVTAARAELAGLNLACWCPPGQPCHADLLLTLANSTHPSPAAENDGSPSSPHLPVLKGGRSEKP